MNKYIKHFYTITKHRLIVRHLCFKCGYYIRGLKHDLSKYSITEFSSSARYFQGTRSPIDAEKEDRGYSLAWQHHKGHNPHHWEYWLDYINTDSDNCVALKIPYQYVVEMICDWVGAGIVYSKQKPDFDTPYAEPLIYFEKHLKYRKFNEDTLDLIYYFLHLIEQGGINKFCDTVKTQKHLIELIYKHS